MVGWSINKKRFIYNTHENAERPYYVTALLKTCTKARQSTLVENLASLAYHKLRQGFGFPIPKRAAPILVDLAVELGVLERDVYKQGFIKKWGAPGYVVDVISPEIPSGLPGDLKLLDRDRLAFLKYYLDANGITFLHLLRLLQTDGKIEQAEFLKGNYVEEMWRSIIKGSLSNVRNDRLRSEMRDTLKKSRFLAGRPRAKGRALQHVRKHKFTPHIEALVDLDIVERSPPSSDWRETAEALRKEDKGLEKDGTVAQETVSYRPKTVDSVNRVSRFLESFRDPTTLDRVISSDRGTFFAYAADLYGLKCFRVKLDNDFEVVKKEVIKSYEAVRDDVYRLALLDAIKDIVCINLQVFHGRICEPQDVWATIEQMHGLSEKDVRYHRDNYGVITYVAMSKNYVDGILSA